MEERGHTLRAILSYPAREALAGAVDGVAGAVVGAEADLSAGPPIPAAWTDCKTHRKQIYKTTLICIFSLTCKD